MADRLGARAGDPGPAGESQKRCSYPVLRWEPFEIRQGNPPGAKQEAFG